MKYITIPKSSDTTIDLAVITNNYKGIIIAYKEGMAVGSISYCSDTDLWYFCDNIDNNQFNTCKDTLLELVNDLIDTKHIADNFRLLEFYTNNDDQQRRHFTGSFT